MRSMWAWPAEASNKVVAASNAESARRMRFFLLGSQWHRSGYTDCRQFVSNVATKFVHNEPCQEKVTRPLMARVSSLCVRMLSDACRLSCYGVWGDTSEDKVVTCLDMIH